MNTNTNESIDKARELLQEAQVKQDKSYERHVVDRIMNDESPEDISKGYNDFIESTNGFHATGFQQTVQSILEEDEETIARFAEKFEKIPEYIKAEDTRRDKVIEIAKSGDRQDIRQMETHLVNQKVENLQRDVLGLFNEMNEYAESKHIIPPYPTNKPSALGVNRYDNRDINQRDVVKDIIMDNMTILEGTNEFVQEKTHAQMSVPELQEEAEKVAETELKDSIEELSEMEEVKLSQ